MQHRYHLGETLDLRANPRLSNRPSGLCEVLACLPHDKGPLLYRVKCIAENNERVVEESDLSPSLDRIEALPSAGARFSIAIPRK
jgi:hypothetical protein